ncbi:MAG TPA: ribokinase [Ruminococcaceae bacterium]|nr:ribokinase [Oscillospiraceae bacterium]
MAKILSFGSLNFDYVYQTEHFVQPKETLSALSYQRGFGGKGLNQSTAMKKAGLEVFHAGRIGADGQPFVDYLSELGIRTDFLVRDETGVTGHAMIEVCGGENRILIHGGANRKIDEIQIDRTLSAFGAGDWLVIQNEISSVPYLIRAAKKAGLKVFFNVAPVAEEVLAYPLNEADVLCVNEIEGQFLAETEESDARIIAERLHKKYPAPEILLTAGVEGSYCINGYGSFFEPACSVKAVDTTAAGDTYSGFYLAEKIRSNDAQKAMHYAAKAAAITVQRVGASQSIPTADEIQ